MPFLKLRENLILKILSKRIQISPMNKHFLFFSLFFSKITLITIELKNLTGRHPGRTSNNGE